MLKFKITIPFSLYLFRANTHKKETKIEIRKNKKKSDPLLHLKQQVPLERR